MKADKDDAPEYLRRKRSQNLGKWALPIALGLGLSGLALHMAGSKRLFLPQSQANHLSYPENSTRISNYNALEKQPQKTSEELFWESVNARNKSNQPKQTAYDDSNYTPTGAVNVVSMEAMRQSNGYRNPSTSRKKKTINRILEKEHPELDIVLVKADTSEEVRIAFKNYFSDAKDFLRLLTEGQKSLETQVAQEDA